MYAWSSLAGLLQAQYNYTAAQTQIIFGVTISAFTITMVFAGRLERKAGPRIVTVIGGILFSLGYYIASQNVASFGVVLVGIGILSGMGIGCGYMCPLATCVKWFPDKKGTITGIAVLGFGAGAILLSLLIERWADAGVGLSYIFTSIAILYGAVVVAGGLALDSPLGYAGKTASASVQGGLFRDPTFRILCFGIFCGTFAGLLVVGSLRQIAIHTGVSEDASTFAISMFAAGNALGRIIWGTVLDRIGELTIPIALVFLSFSIAAERLPLHSDSVFLGVALLIGLGFGANFVLFAAQTAIHYGAGEVGRIYPVIFLFYGFAALTGPFVGGWLFDRTGTYSTAILIAASLPLAGAALYFRARKSRFFK